MPDIHHAIIISAPASKVYDAITSEQGLSSWWTPGTTTEGGINTIARFPFGDEYYKEMKITELSKGTLIRWVCIKGDNEWVGTNLSFKLEDGDRKALLGIHPEVKGQLEQQPDNGSVTLLTFHHSQWKQYSPMFAECNYTWALFLRSLKFFCETGKGNPWPNQHRTRR